MKIKTIKKWCCNAMSGGLLAVLPMFFLFSVANTELNAQQVDRPYTETTVTNAIETLTSEMINLRLEVRNQGGSDENYLLMEYYPVVINELRSGATFEDAFITSLNVFFNSQHSNQVSNLHLSIFGIPHVTDPSGGDPASVELSAVASPSYYHGAVVPEFKQLIDVIDSSEGHPSAMQALFNFMNTNK